MKSLQELLQPQQAEPDASIVEIFGEKSKDADDIKDYVYNLHGTIGPTSNGSLSSMLSGTGGKNIFGQEVAPLTEEDLITMAMGIAGGIKTPGRMFGSIPKATKKMPKTQYQYEKPEFTPNPTGTFRNKQNVLVNVETTPQRLFRELTEGSLDSYEFQMKLRELEDIAPEMAGKVINAIGF